MIGQIRNGESGFGEMVKFLLARVTGTRDGIPAVVTRRTPVSGPGSHFMRDMAAITGTSCAAFMMLAVDENGTRTGPFAPEDWADPHAFYKALERVGTPRAEIVESVT